MMCRNCAKSWSYKRKGTQSLPSRFFWTQGRATSAEEPITWTDKREIKGNEEAVLERTGVLPEGLGELQREGAVSAGPWKMSELSLDEGRLRNREHQGSFASDHSAFHGPTQASRVRQWLRLARYQGRKWNPFHTPFLGSNHANN